MTGEPAGSEVALLAIRRGDIVTAVAQGAYGKPRPMIVVQSDALNRHHPSVILCPLTTRLLDAPEIRVPVEPDSTNGLQASSQAMSDKIFALDRRRIGGLVGRLSNRDMERVEAAIRICLQLPNPKRAGGEGA